MKNSEQLLPTEYQSIVYDEGNDIFTIEKSKKYGITNKEGKILVPTEYKQIDVTGIYLYAQNEQGTTVYNTEGTQVNIDTSVAILNTNNEKYKIKITNKDGTKYGGIGNKGEEIIYADSLWIHTKESVNNLVSFFEELDSLEPSAIFPLSETEDYFQKKILLFQSTGDIVNLKDKVNESFMKDIKCIYWD